MLLRFIGEDGSMGLRKGKIYNCSVVAASDYYIWVSWNMDSPSCPYKSFKKLFENWEEVGDED